ncbi:radical SAM protein [Thiospirillum jenense]|uniref:Radical SAM protein n=2 Tax=Thiospirillum jenense TaxID=1653858 RepID=A0A839HDW4_9GAMM|nr:radical SAM protein [Thiospirillum jenense]
MREIEFLPEIKFVTNGRAISDELIAELNQYPGRIRFNISLHSLIPEQYQRIIRNHLVGELPPQHHDDLAAVKDNLQRLRAAQIPFKLNCVLLKGINTDPAQLDSFLAQASALGAERVKFLELLITEELKWFYPYFYRLEALENQFAARFEFLNTGARRRVYRDRLTQLVVELQQCTCRLGCDQCAINRDINVTAELRYFACFLHPEDALDLKQTDLNTALAQGVDYIDRMAIRYGSGSPIIIGDFYVTEQEQFYYYALPHDALPAVIAQCGSIELKRHRCFTEYYFSDGSSDYAGFTTVKKLMHNSYEHQAQEVVQSVRVDALGSGLIETVFLTDGAAISSIEQYSAAMRQAGFNCVLTVEWAIDYFTLGEIEITLSQTPQRSDAALLRCNRPLLLAQPGLQPLTCPIPVWLMQQAV